MNGDRDAPKEAGTSASGPRSESAPGDAPSGRGRGWGRFGLLLASVVVAALLAELVARVAHRWNEGAVQIAAGPAGQQPEPGVDLSDRIAHFRISPLLGFQRAPGGALRDQFKPAFLRALGGPGDDDSWQEVSTNNLGFFSPHDYPYRAASDEYVVGIFGGSVARWFALQMGSRLATWLEARPTTAGRKVVVLNLAAGAFKQPQQLHLLADLLAQGQRFDLVVNIDGFNEVGINKSNARKGIPLSAPAASRILPLAELASARSDRDGVIELGRVADLRSREERLLEMRDECRLALCVLWRDLQLTRVRRELAAALESRSAPEPGGSLLEIGRVAERPGLDYLPEAVALWAESSKLMHTLLRERSVPYLHVLQPNQYVGGHRLTAREKRTAFSPGMDMRDAVQAGYPLLLQRSDELWRAGVGFASAVEVFDHEAQTVYVDVCCHFNRRGNELLLAFVESELEKSARLARAGR